MIRESWRPEKVPLFCAGLWATFKLYYMYHSPGPNRTTLCNHTHTHIYSFHTNILGQDGVTRVTGLTMLRYNQHVFRRTTGQFVEEIWESKLCSENFAIWEFRAKFAMHCAKFELNINFDTGDFIEQLTLFVLRYGIRTTFGWSAPLPKTGALNSSQENGLRFRTISSFQLCALGGVWGAGKAPSPRSCSVPAACSLWAGNLQGVSLGRCMGCGGGEGRSSIQLPRQTKTNHLALMAYGGSAFNQKPQAVKRTDSGR